MSSSKTQIDKVVVQNEINVAVMNNKVDNLTTIFKDYVKKDEEVKRLILKQTSETNGRVNKLEGWKNAFILAIGALWVIIITISPLVWSYMLNQVDEKVNTSKIEIKEEVKLIINKLNN